MVLFVCVTARIHAHIYFVKCGALVQFCWQLKICDAPLNLDECKIGMLYAYGAPYVYLHFIAFAFDSHCTSTICCFASRKCILHNKVVTAIMTKAAAAARTMVTMITANSILLLQYLHIYSSVYHAVLKVIENGTKISKRLLLNAIFHAKLNSSIFKKC